jgi:hypothetical protein
MSTEGMLGRIVAAFIAFVIHTQKFAVIKLIIISHNKKYERG